MDTQQRIGLIGALLLLTGCDQWDAMISLENEFEPHRTIQGFKSFELCRDAAVDELRRLPEEMRSIAYYDCGRGCRFDPDYGHTICKESRD